MRHSLLPTTAIVWTLVQGAALAAPASQMFRDVPAGHWAENAVSQVAVERAFMKGYPDGTFRGDQPFTRVQLALAVAELVKELETITQTSWATQGLGGYQFQDLPADPQVRAIVLRMANQYRLFEGVPGVTSQTLEAQKQVTRYEMAKVVHRLMRLGEEQGLVDPAVQQAQDYTFTDVPPSAWAYNEVQAVSDRYQVMVGFPDATFRGREELTRYQFAASAAQTFPLVRTLVEKTQEKKEAEEAVVAAALRFQESHPLMVGATAGLTGPVGPAASARYARYFGPLFLLADAELGTQVAAGDRLYGGSLNVGYAFPVGGAYLQPYLGARAITTGANTLGGLNAGLVGYLRPSDAWGFFLKGHGTAPLGATSGAVMGNLFGGGSAGVEYYFTPSFGLVAEAGYGTVPGTLGQPASPFATEGAATGTFGLQLGF